MKKVNSIFDVLGPIMIGPSSSHTAGAARLAKIAGEICHDKIKKVKFYLHGSFKETYKGHGTDRALLAGILGYDPHDERLRNAIDIAEEEGIEYEFIPTDLGPVHPNTVKFEITDVNDKVTTVIGSSIGGGSVLITNINGFEVQFTGAYHTIMTRHNDVKGVVSEVASIISDNDINIATMNVSRSSRGKEASMIIETDSVVSKEVMDKIKDIDAMISVIDIHPVREGEVNV